MGNYYNKSGEPLKLMEWAELMENREYCRIAYTPLWWGGRVSTIWLGLDFGFNNDDKPLIFETMVFGWIKAVSGDQDNYATLYEAKKGHKKMVRKCNNLFYLLVNLWLAMRNKWRNK